MENAIKQINVEEILEEIRREIKEKGYKNEDILFTDIPARFAIGGLAHSGEFTEHLGDLGNCYNVAVYRPIVSKRLFGSLIVFIRRVIRKLVGFFIEPIVTDQNQNNRRTTICLQDLYLDIEEMRIIIKSLEDDINQIKEKAGVD